MRRKTCRSAARVYPSPGPRWLQTPAGGNLGSGIRKDKVYRITLFFRASESRLCGRGARGPVYDDRQVGLFSRRRCPVWTRARRGAARTTPFHRLSPGKRCQTRPTAPWRRRAAALTRSPETSMGRGCRDVPRPDAAAELVLELVERAGARSASWTSPSTGDTRILPAASS